MATYYAELTGGEIVSSVSFEGGVIYAEETLSGGEIYPGGGGGGASLETKSVSYTPSETAISDTLTPSAGYDGFDEVDVSVDAIPSNYVGSGVPRRDSLDLTKSGATVNVPSGFYEYNSSATIPSAPLPTLSSATINSSGTLRVMANLSSDGYLPSGNLPLTLANAFAVQGAQTYTPGTTDQAISANQYLTGAQTILGDADLVASNIKKDVEIFGVTGTYEGGTPTPSPYHLKVDPNGLFFCFGGADYSSSRMAINTNTAIRRSLWAINGDSRAAYGTTSNRTNCHGIPVPADATTMALTIDQTCEVSIREYWGSGSSISSSTATSWLSITADTPLTYTLSSGVNYVGFSFRVSSSNPSYTSATEPTSASIDFS